MSTEAEKLAADVAAAPGTPEERRAARATRRRPMVALKATYSADRTFMQRFADELIRIGGSTPFLAFHGIWFGVWILWNTGQLWLPIVDPFPFGLLTMIVSLEAIFLSIFVLIGQGREAAIAELREELTLQVNLRIEAEVTKTLQLVAGLYTRMGYKFAQDDDLKEMLNTLDAESMERQLLEQIRSIGVRRPRKS
jgi:uncharacterized membrane protein